MKLRKTKIVCTIGPATNSYEAIKDLILSGMNVARFNFSHGSWEDEMQQKMFDLVKKARKELNIPVALLVDLKGPEIRLGKIEGKVFLDEGKTFVLKNDDIVGDESCASVSYKNLYKDVFIGSNILLDDGAIKLTVLEIKDKDIYCSINNSGYIISNRGVNVPDIVLNFPPLTDKDITDINGAIRNDADYIAASFVRRKEDVLAIKKILDANNSKIRIISKIENAEGINNFDEILEISDGIMVARGDLGIEIPFSKVPVYQKQMIKKCFMHGKPVITATQMLETMINEPNPTRAEVSDVANAIYDGTSAIMLSGETAMGKYPSLCVKKMHQIALEIEGAIDYWKRFKNRPIPNYNFEYVIDHAMITTALNINVKAIFCYTTTSDTPRIVSSLRPKCPIFVTTTNPKILNQLALIWGINASYANDINKDPKEIILDDIHKRTSEGILEADDIVLIAGGKYIPKDYRDINKSIGGIYQI